MALVLGMIIGYSGKKPSASTGQQKGIVSLPTGGTGGAGVSPGTTDGVSSTTSTTTTAAAAGSQVAVVLMPATKGQGVTDLPSFTTAGSWSIGWAFSCAHAAGGSGTFTITVVPATGTASTTPAVSQTSNAMQGVNNEPSTDGTEHLHVATSDPTCIWIVKVTGIS